VGVAKSNQPLVKLQPRVICPHCWHVYAPEESLWVAQHPDLLNDPKLGKDQHRRFLPTRFTVEGNALDTEGVACQGLACPHCHLSVPRTLLEMETLFFSILGAPASGKSYFLASMTWQLRKNLPRYFQLSFGDADPAANISLNSYEELLFLSGDPDGLVALPKTDVHGEHLYDSVRYGEQTVVYPRPYVFGLRPLEGHPNHSQIDRLSRGLCLYDNAGEHFLPGADKVGSPVTRHLPLSRVLFFLFDPTQDPDFRKACADHTRDPQMKDQARNYRQELILLEAADRVRRLSGLPQNAKHPRPLIVIVTKYDAWRSLLPKYGAKLDLQTLLKPTLNGGSALRMDLLAEISRDVRAMLCKYRSEFVTAAEGFCEEVIYLPVSALGHGPKIDPKSGQLCVRPSEIEPMWAELPMVYALARWMQGFVPFVNASSGGAATAQPARPTAPGARV
jgi:hypothetical protein